MPTDIYILNQVENKDGLDPSEIEKAIKSVREEYPKLYKVHKDYFDALSMISNSYVYASIKSAMYELFEEFKSSRKSLYICFKNRLSRWTDLCLRLTFRREFPNVILERVTIMKVYRVQSVAIYLVYLREPTLDDLYRYIDNVLHDEEELEMDAVIDP